MQYVPWQTVVRGARQILGKEEGQHPQETDKVRGANDGGEREDRHSGRHLRWPGGGARMPCSWWPERSCGD